MTVHSIAPGGSREAYDGYADFARAQKAQGLAPRGQGLDNSASAKPATGVETMAWGEDGFTFGDVLDIINPLQHIPVISDIYRAVTGDQISPAARLAGGGILGGIPGLAVAAVNTVVQEISGQDLGQVAMASLFGDDAAGDLPSDITGETAIASLLGPAGQSDNVQKQTPGALQFASAAPAATSNQGTIPGAAAGSSNAAAQTASSGIINFFNRPVSPAATAATANATTGTITASAPGALPNRFFTPLAGPPASQAASQATGQASDSAARIVPTNLVLANQVAPAPASPPARIISAGQPGPATDQAARPTVMPDNGLTPAQQKIANREALLAAARDLRSAFQSHNGYKTTERLNELQAKQPAQQGPSQ